MAWVQFSISVKGNKRFPVEAFDSFLCILSAHLTTHRWHYLFEPNLLVRVETDSPVLVDTARKLALWNGLDFHEGDLAKSSPGGRHGLHDFEGESAFYGSNPLWQANADFLNATSRLVLQLDNEGKRNWRMIRKHVHLLCNQAGMHYGQEAWFAFRYAVRALWLFIRLGRQ